MADKEPRRRRKRKDAGRKDEPQLTELNPSETQPSSVHSKDFDQDLDEESVPPEFHQPSKLAQIVFFILFLLLSVTIGSVFIALHGSSDFSRDSADILTTMNLDVIESSIGDDIHSEIVFKEPFESAEDDGDFVSEEESILASESDFKEEYSQLDDLEQPEYFEKTETEFLGEITGLRSDIDIEPFIEPSDSSIGSSESSVQDDFAVNKIDDDDEEISIYDPDENPEKESTTEDPASAISFSDVENAHIFNDKQDETFVDESLDIEPFVDIIESENIEKEIQVGTKDELAITIDGGSDVKKTDTIPSKDVLDDIASESRDAAFSDNLFVAQKDKPEDDFIPNIFPQNIDSSKSIETPKPPSESNLHVNTLDVNTKVQHLEESNANLEQENEFAHSKADLSSKKEVINSEADLVDENKVLLERQLREIEEIVQKNPENALQKYEQLLNTYPSSPHALFGKAQVLDLLADLQRSNKLLEDAVSTYQEILSLKDVPDELYIAAGMRCAERLQFRGFVGKSIKVLLEIGNRFPNDVNIKNKIGVGYLLIGQNTKAKEVFTQVIVREPDNGFAKVHLGFILKTTESKYEEAIELLMKGIASREEGVVDGRFFFHLGDALARVGRTTEAMKIYEQGVRENLFLSVYQRSLYNVVGLTGRPWWNPENSKYSGYFKILEKNWAAIKAEALSLLGSTKFIPEGEGLKNYGEWEQFELFVRGKKVHKNCGLAHFTCSLIEQMPDASMCKRGQVKFSIMKPGTHVWAHTGPTNCRLRAHLGLVIPDGVFIRVANDTRTWHEGKVILFDDSFEHEVWHNGTSQRLVLIVDFWHPELTGSQRAMLSPI